MTTALNDHIAKAEGWTRIVTGNKLKGVFVFWRNPEGDPTTRPNFTGTLEGVAGMMRELGHQWEWAWDDLAGGKAYICLRRLKGLPEEWFHSAKDHPGDCVGEAYLSVFGKDEDDPKMP